MSILHGTLAFAAYREGDKHIILESVSPQRGDVVEYLNQSFADDSRRWNGFKPQKVMIVPVDFGQT